MLTIKMETSDRSSTITHLAHSVVCQYPKPENPQHRAAHAFPRLVEYEREDGTYCSVGSGTVWVMNEAGKTIDTYYPNEEMPEVMKDTNKEKDDATRAKVHQVSSE